MVELNDKFKNKVKCICKNFVYFEYIDSVECDWGIHTIIQCPTCQELFTIDTECVAFNSIKKLVHENLNLLSENEILEYSKNSHLGIK
jgi:hypothetical protein